MRHKAFSIQIDEATDCSGIGHLIAYVRYAEDTTINEDMLFCKPIKRRAIAKKNSSKLLMISRKKKASNGETVLECAACVMAENKERVQTLIK
jgi:hypothetical protein